MKDCGAMGTERMASPDAAWLRMDLPTNRMVVTTVLWFDEALDWSRVVAALTERVVTPFRRFRQRVVESPVTVGLLGAPRWVDDDDFDIERHLRRARLPSPGGMEDLQRYASSQAGTELDRSLPLWEAHLLDGFGDGSAILLRTHHALADGTALVQVLLHLTDPPQGEEQAGRMPLAAPSRDGDLAAQAATAARAARRTAGRYVRAWMRPGEALDLVDAARDDAATLSKLGFGLAEQRNALRGALRGDKALSWSEPIPLDTVKRIGGATGSTVNDVALAIIAGGLRRYLDERGDLPPRRFTAMVPVNVRPSDVPLAPELGNRFGLVFVTLPVDTDDPAQRLDEVSRQMRAIKASQEAMVVYGALGAMGQSPAQLQRAWIDVFTRKASAVVTNIAGPRAPVRLAGVPLRGFVLWVPASGSIGVGVSICSYDGEVTLGVAVDTALVPDGDRLVAALTQETEAMARRSAT